MDIQAHTSFHLLIAKGYQEDKSVTLLDQAGNTNLLGPFLSYKENEVL